VSYQSPPLPITPRRFYIFLSLPTTSWRTPPLTTWSTTLCFLKKQINIMYPPASIQLIVWQSDQSRCRRAACAKESNQASTFRGKLTSSSRT